VTRRRMLVAVLVLALVGVLVGVGVAGVAVWRHLHRSELDRAMSLLPPDTRRASWTDWSGVRSTLGAEDLSGDDPPALRTFLGKAFSSDLSAASTIDDSAVALAIHYGFSPATADWELYGQANDGAVMLLKLPDDTDFAALADRLAALGYTRPPSDTGVWVGGEDVVARIDPTITPELQYVALLADQHLVLTSDADAYLTSAVDAATGDGLATPDVVGELEEPLSATVFVGDFACEALAMSQADPEEQSEATNLVEDAGGINPVTGLAVAAYADRRLRVALAFENADQAKRNATSRVRLASGPAPGQGSDFPDLFSISQAHRDGSTVVLDLQARPDSYALSNLISGPVVFESC
jgi:hypothetical protein